MNKLAENQINQFISEKLITERKTLSEAFDMKCEKISLDNNEVFVAKYYQQNNKNFNSIVSEVNSLEFLCKKFPNLFPHIKYKSNNLFIMDYIENNNIKDENYQEQLAREIIKIHNTSNDSFGFEFDAQVGGLQQSNCFNLSWVNFFRENRLNMIFEKINEKSPMPKDINDKIEKIMKDLKNRLPNKPNISLLHGDLWEGNILFFNGKLVGLIDPGIFFGHNEMEIAYLVWFNYIDDKFLNYYSNEIKINKNFLDYAPIYQLFYSLLNVYLWDRDFYLKDTASLLKKII